MPAGDITPDDGRQPKLGRVVYDTGGNCPNCGYGAGFLYAWPRIDRLGERFYALTTN